MSRYEEKSKTGTTLTVAKLLAAKKAIIEQQNAGPNYVIYKGKIYNFYKFRELVLAERKHS